ncbi:MAG: hypothetical protein KDA20_12570 [Phycisphaerales bacterium]|nr:hypothetical protein [Phycisphaerales bacterium]
MGPLTGVLGIVALIALSWLISENRKRFPWRMVASGVVLQFVLALLFLKTPGVAQAFNRFAQLVNGVIQRADAGAEFLFGPNLMDPTQSWGFIFAIKVLPVIIFFASLMAVLYHVGLMQRLVAGLAWLLRTTMGVTGAESLAMASNVFVGQTEAPLCIRPYLPTFTRAQLATLMVGGFATIAGSVLAAYVGILGGTDHAQQVEFVKHLITASIMSAPAAFVMARIIVPETEQPPDEHVHAAPAGYQASNVLDAAAHGASEGLKLALNVGAMLIAFVALLHLVDWPLEGLSEVPAVRSWLDARGIDHLGLKVILGWVFTPLAWMMGVPGADASAVGSLMGQKLVLTEFYAYIDLGNMLHGPDGATISVRSGKIATYALCGFANFASIAIQIGGLTVLAPERRRDIVSLSVRAMFGGAFASWMTAAVAGILIGS